MPILVNLVGETVIKIKRAFYEYRGEVNRLFGDIEFTFASGPVVVLGVGKDGETLTASGEGIRDIFAGPLAPENAQYVAEYGKWTIFDVSDWRDYTGFVGRPIIEVVPIKNSLGKLVGVNLLTQTRCVRVRAEFDDLVVTTASASARG